MYGDARNSNGNSKIWMMELDNGILQIPYLNLESQKF